MTIIIFIIILLALVLIHEAGHFFAAKATGVRVDEFAFGFPPRLYSVKKGETTYAFNALPIGGYVKIHGENGEDGDSKRNFVNKSALVKIFILGAGVIMNIVLAYLLITISFYFSTAFTVDRNSLEYQKFVSEGRVREENVLISNVVKNSPAEFAGLKVGYKVEKVYVNQEDEIGRVALHRSVNLDGDGNDITENISKAINTTNTGFNDSVTVVYRNNKNQLASSTIAGVYNLGGETDKKMIGLSFAKVANIKLRAGETIVVGLDKTIEFTKYTIIGFKDLFIDLFKTGKISESVTGPVGMVREVGNVRSMGINYLLLFAAVLSISLAVFNILPFPALDGGRILFVLIELITRKKIPEKWQGILNGAGFSILIILMIIITVKDVVKLF